MDIWIYGYMDIWIYGYMDVWIYDIWIYGYMDIWIYGYMDIWIYGYSPNRFICRGSYGVGKGALLGLPLRPRLCCLTFVRRLRERCMSPSPLSYEIGIRGHCGGKT